MTYAASLTVSNFLSKLQGVRGGDGQWQARCPCRNDDSNPSLSVKDDNGKVVVYCHRGKPCSASEICEAIGITQKDLFPPSATFDKNNKHCMYCWCKIFLLDLRSKYKTLLFSIECGVAGATLPFTCASCGFHQLSKSDFANCTTVIFMGSV